MIRQITLVIALFGLTLDGFCQPSITLSSSEPSTCIGENATYVVDTSGCGSDAQIEWFVNDTSVFLGDSISITIDSLTSVDQISAIYTCLDVNGNPVSSANSNTLMATIEDPGANAGDDMHILLGSSVTLSGSGSGTLLWGPSEGLSSTTSSSPIATPETTTTYFLTVTSVDGCVSQDEVIVYVYKVTAANTITPNDDGYNDYWEIFGISNFPNAKVSVYTRWGQKVFNEVGYTSDKRWNGTNGGLSLPAGTYYYIIDLNSDGENDIIPGFVTIVK